MLLVYGQVGLIVGLLVGTVGAGTFVGLQIAQEGRTAVLAVTEALPTWSLKSSSSEQHTALARQVAALCNLCLCSTLCSNAGNECLL